MQDIYKDLDAKTETEKIIYLTEVLSQEKDEEKRNSIHKILDELVQLKYKRLMERRLVHGIEKLYEITEIKPDIDEDFIQNAYEELLERRGNGYAEKIKKIMEITSVKPKLDGDMVQSVYEESIKAEKVFDFELIWETTGIKPRDSLVREFEDLKSKISQEIHKWRE